MTFFFSVNFFDVVYPVFHVFMTKGSRAKDLCWGNLALHGDMYFCFAGEKYELVGLACPQRAY